MTNGTPPPPPGAVSPKQGMATWAKVALGCGIIAVLCFVAFIALGAFVFKKGKEAVQEATGVESFEEFVDDLKDNPAKAAAELAVNVNPDLKLVSTDDEAGTITFTNEKTGEEATLNFEDIAEGRFSMTTDEGEYRLDASQEGGGGVTMTGPEGESRFGASVDLSDVPDWAPRYPGMTDTQSTMHSTSPNGMMGAFSGKSTDDAQKVIDHFRSLFEASDYKVGSESMNKTGDGAFGAINGDLGDGRTVNVVVIESKGESHVTINYNQKK